MDSPRRRAPVPVEIGARLLNVCFVFLFSFHCGDIDDDLV